MNDYIIGAISGIGQVIVGHPFDTIKVRRQNFANNSSLKLSHYFRGIGYPVVASSIVNSIVFGTYYNSKQYTNNNFLSGMLSGICCSPVVYSFDIFKTKRQMGKNVKFSDFYTSKGFSTCLLREIFAFGIYFSTYDYMRETLHYNSLISGGVAGVLNWTFTYPLDVIRNRQIIYNCSFKNAIYMGDMWKGYNICIVRALLVNSFGFYIFDECKKLST